MPMSRTRRFATLTYTTARSNPPADCPQYFRKSLAFQSPEELPINGIPQAFNADIGNRQDRGRQPHVAQQARFVLQSSDANYINIECTAKKPYKEEKQSKAVPHPTPLPFGPSLEAPENGDDIVLVERSPPFYKKPTTVKPTFVLDINWIVHHIIVSTLRPGVTAESVGSVAQLKLIVKPLVKAMCNILTPATNIICLALYYIDSLFQNRELAGLQKELRSPFHLATVVVRMFGLTLNLAFKWFEDYAKPMATIQRVLNSSWWNAIGAEVKMLNAFGSDPSLRPAEWAVWLRELLDMCGQDVNCCIPGASNSYRAIEGLISQLDDKVTSPSSPDSYIPNHVDPSKVPDVVAGLLERIERPFSYRPLPPRSLALCSIGQEFAIWAWT